MSRIEKDTGANKIYLKIVEGSLRQKSQEGIPDAVRREWQVGGDSGVVWEIPSKAASGKITEVSFYEGEADGRKFTTLNLHLDENEDGKIPVITAGITTKYAQEILKKLPNIRPDEEVRIRPYSYLKDGDDKNTVGVEITRRDHADNFTLKVNDFFYDWDKREVKNGYPTPPKPKEEMTSKDWRRYFEDANEFVIEYVKTKVAPKFNNDKVGSPTEELDKVIDGEDEMPESLRKVRGDINPDDIPFWVWD